MITRLFAVCEFICSQAVHSAGANVPISFTVVVAGSSTVMTGKDSN